MDTTPPAHSDERTCPRCGQAVEPVPVVYGYPSAELMETAQRGEVRLGGCVLTGDDPTHACPSCGTELNDGQP